MFNNHHFITFALSLPSIRESLTEIAESRALYKLEKRATEAGYDDVGKYLLACHRKDPKYPARRYLECVNEYGAESTFCKKEKEHWMELKAKQNANKVAWNEENEEEIHKMLEEDAIQAGYIKGYFLKKDPSYLELATREYEKCIAKHGVGNKLCNYHKIVWLKAKVFRNSN